MKIKMIDKDGQFHDCYLIRQDDDYFLTGSDGDLIGNVAQRKLVPVSWSDIQDLRAFREWASSLDEGDYKSHALSWAWKCLREK